MSHQTSIPPIVTTQDGPMEGTRKSHPAFGVLRFSRVSGGSGNLYGSEINHNSYIKMELQPSEEVRSLSHTWYFGQSKCLVQVDMSAAQFAELISSLNVGSGVPCTIRYMNGIGHIPEIADDGDTFHEQIKNDIKDKTHVIVDTAVALEKELAKMLAESKLPKVKQEALRGLCAKITMELRSNMPYILEQYQEGAEKIGAKAKAELDAFYTHQITKLGLDTLRKLNEEVGGTAIEMRESDSAAAQ